jgi:predicted transcriptional regulator of viral defense system
VNGKPREPLIKFVRKLRRPVFTTRELSALAGKSLSTTSQGLRYLTEQGILIKIRRGLWAEADGDRLSAYSLVSFLVPGHRAYVSFLSALHLHGIIEQTPQVNTIASTAHSRTIRTPLGTFRIHQISPGMFAGFDWNGPDRAFLLASAEKALVDSLYLSAHRKKQYGNFSELEFPGSFSFAKAGQWARRIRAQRVQAIVLRELDRLSGR